MDLYFWNGECLWPAFPKELKKLEIDPRDFIDHTAPKPVFITDVMFNPPATIVFWSDDTKTVVKTQCGDIYDPEKGLAMAISKKFFGNTGRYYKEFTKWVPYDDPNLEPGGNPGSFRTKKGEDPKGPIFSYIDLQYMWRRDHGRELPTSDGWPLEFEKSAMSNTIFVKYQDGLWKRYHVNIDGFEVKDGEG